MSKQISIRPKGQKLFFKVEFNNSNAAYDWEYRDHTTPDINDKGQGNSEEDKAIKFENNDNQCNAQDLYITVAAGNMNGSTVKTSVYQGIDVANAVLVDTFEEDITTIPFVSAINFVTV